MWIGRAVAGAIKRKGPPVADLGTDSTLYYNEELKAWVEKGKEEEVRKQQQASAAPPVMAVKLKPTNSRRGGPASRYAMVDNLNVTSGPPSNDSNNSLLLPGHPSAPATPGGPPKFFIPTQPVQQQTSDTKFRGYPESSPSPVSVLSGHKAGTSTDTDDSRPNSALDASTAPTSPTKAPAMSAEPLMAAPQHQQESSQDDIVLTSSPSPDHATSSSPALQLCARDADTPSPSPAAATAPLSAASSRSSTVGTTGRSISVEDHEENKQKFFSRFLPQDKKAGKVSQIWDEEGFANMDTIATGGSFQPLFAWDAAGKAGLRSSWDPKMSVSAPAEPEAAQRKSKSQRTSLDRTSAVSPTADLAQGLAAAEDLAAVVAAAAQPSVWGPRSASSIYSASTSAKDEPAPELSYPQEQQQHQQQQEEAPEATTQCASSQPAAEQPPAAEASWDSGQEVPYDPPAVAPAVVAIGDAPAAAEQPAAADPEGASFYIPEQGEEQQAAASGYDEYSSYYANVSMAAEASSVAMGAETSYASYGSYSGYTATAAATSEPAAEAEAAANSAAEAAAVPAGSDFAPWDSLVNSMQNSFADHPEMQGHVAYFVQYGNFIFNAIPNKEELLQQLQPQVPAAAAQPAAADSSDNGSGDMSVELEAAGGSGSKSAVLESAEQKIAAGGMMLTEDELAAWGEMMFKQEVMEAVFASAGLSVAGLLECL